MNWPEEFFTDAYVNPFSSAYACSTYPTAPGVCLIAAATPELPLAPVPVGHFTSFPWPTDEAHAGSAAVRNLVKPSVVPEESDRWTTVIAVLGRLRPGLSDLIAGSFQALIWPRKIFA